MDNSVAPGPSKPARQKHPSRYRKRKKDGPVTTSKSLCQTAVKVGSGRKLVLRPVSIQFGRRRDTRTTRPRNVSTAGDVEDGWFDWDYGGAGQRPGRPRRLEKSEDEKWAAARESFGLQYYT